MTNVLDYVYVLGYIYTCHTLKNITDTHNNYTRLTQDCNNMRLSG
jgi:hypothetical protein